MRERFDTYDKVPPGSVVKSLGQSDVLVRFHDGSWWCCIGLTPESDSAPNQIGWEWESVPASPGGHG